MTNPLDGVTGRTVPFKRDKVCDDCGAKGAYDFMGDYLCPECAAKALKESGADQEGGR